MTNITEIDIPDYFPSKEVDKQEVNHFGRMEPLTKKIKGVSVTLSRSSNAGCSLTFKGLKVETLTMGVDGDYINQVTHFMLTGNSIL